MAMLQVDGLRIPFEARTLGGFRKWFGGLGERAPRASFIDGDVYVEMTPQSCRTHAPIVQAINARLLNLADASGRGVYHLPPSWFTHRKARVSTEPDGFFVTYQTLRRGLLRINPTCDLEMLGRPDFALEVVSRSAPEKDLVRLRRDYARAGVREYWIVDALGEQVEFTTLVLKRGEYVEVPVDAAGWRTSPTWRRAFRLRRLRSRAGLPRYSLDLRDA